MEREREQALKYVPGRRGAEGELCLRLRISNELPPGDAKAAGRQMEEQGSRVSNLTFLSFSFI